MSKVTPYPLRIVKCARGLIHKSRKQPPKKSDRKHPLLKGNRGDGFPLTIAVTFCLLLIFFGISEYFRVTIIAQGIRDRRRRIGLLDGRTHRTPRCGNLLRTSQRPVAALSANTRAR